MHYIHCSPGLLLAYASWHPKQNTSVLSASNSISIRLFVLLLFLVEAFFRQPAAFFLFFNSLIWLSFSSACFSGVSVKIAAFLLLVWFFLCFWGAALGCGLTNSGEKCNVRFTKSGFTLSDWSAACIRAE